MNSQGRVFVFVYFSLIRAQAKMDVFLMVSFCQQVNCFLNYSTGIALKGPHLMLGFHFQFLFYWGQSLVSCSFTEIKTQAFSLQRFLNISRAPIEPLSACSYGFQISFSLSLSFLPWTYFILVKSSTHLKRMLYFIKYFSIFCLQKFLRYQVCHIAANGSL